MLYMFHLMDSLILRFYDNLLDHIIIVSRPNACLSEQSIIISNLEMKWLKCIFIAVIHKLL